MALAPCSATALRPETSHTNEDRSGVTRDRARMQRIPGIRNAFIIAGQQFGPRAVYCRMGRIYLTQKGAT